MAEGAHQGRRQRRGRVAPALPMPSPPPAAPARSPRELLLGTRMGRVFLAAALFKLIVVVLGRAGAAPAWLSGLGTLAGIVMVVTAAVFLVRAFVLARRQLLWPVRRKLIVSYVFIGFVPALLLLVFFLFGGQIVFSSVASYLFKMGYERYVVSAGQIAQSTAYDVARAPARAGAVVQDKVDNLIDQYPGLSIAVVPIAEKAPVSFEQAGPWRHLDPPAAPLPGWLSRFRDPTLGSRDVPSFTIVCRMADGGDKLIARGIAFPRGAAPAFAVVADVPVGQEVADRLRETTAIRATGVTAAPMGKGREAGKGGEAGEDRVIEPPACGAGADAGPAGEELPAMPFRYDRSVAFQDYLDWTTGETGQVSIGLTVRLRDLYREVSKGQSLRFGGGSLTLGQLMLALLVTLAILFFIIEVAALVMGLALARSITTAVHELYAGTERVRQGDFTHRIQVQARDQLGQLSDSFNQMSTSIEHLLEQAAEKRRLEEELRIAREIQMSLLPSGPLDMPGISMTALCVPAREVGGDYYDYFRLGEHRFSLLIADVSGKGTSAALYMAELKGLLLSLSTIYQSPRQLLIEANRIISDHLDTRSFITMTYAVIDLEARTLVFARAGHTPFIYLPARAARAARGGPADPPRRAQALVPDGMVLGLQVPNIERLFPHHLVEHTIALETGDVMALYTDGISEAMNAAGDQFGDARLAHLVEEHGHLQVGELRERIVREVEAFAADEDQHDDLTMILLKIEEPGARLPAVHTEGFVEP
ncbi:MAG TPA: SpoIIE family protein phosphatase [Vicinamibacterales bacterium]